MSQQPSLADVFDEHVWDVYGFVAYRVRSRADAEDITQQTFERALGAWKRFDPARASAKTWLLTIARNLVIDHARSGREAKEILREEPPDEVSIDGEAGGLGISPELQAAIGRLTERDREVLALRFGGDMTGPEIAEALDLSLANVQQILSRSLRKLRQELEDRGAPERTT